MPPPDPPIDKRTVARSLDEVSRYLEISEANRFKSIAFRNAARKIDDVSTDMATFVESGAVHKTAGIGKAIGPMIVELVTTGRLNYLEELRKQYPPGILDLMRVPGLGLKKIGILYEKLGVGALEELEQACRENRLVTLDGFGKKTQQKIAEGIEFLRRQGTKVLLPRGLEAAEAARNRLQGVANVREVLIAGAVRRRLEIVQDVVLIVSSDTPEAALTETVRAEALDHASVVSERELTATARHELPLRVVFRKPDEVPAAFLYYTGSDEFISALSLSAAEKKIGLDSSGLRTNGKTITVSNEKEIFKRVGAPYLEPELREDETWLSRRPGKLIEQKDLQGIFHNHSTYSDGRATIREMFSAGRELGYSYFGLSDHSKLASYAGGLTEDRLVEQQGELEQMRSDFPSMRIFRGSEADILADGGIDYGEPTLAQFDFIVASIHSRFKMERDEMTARMLQAIRNPRVTFLGHLTGRLLLSREGYTVEFDKVFDAAARSGVMIEINGSPKRLDLDWRLMQRALDRGVIFSIHPDAHSTQELLYVQNGVWAARKGGLSPKHVFNTLPLEAVEEYLAARRKRADTLLG